MRTYLALASLLAACGDSPSTDSSSTEVPDPQLALGKPPFPPKPITIKTFEGDRLDLPGFKPIVKIKSTPRGPNDITWRGTFGTRGRATFSTSKGQVFGMLVDGKDVYEMTLVNGKPKVTPIDRKKLGLTGKHGEGFRHGPTLTKETQGGSIGVIVAYTAAAAKKCPTIEGRIDTALALTNDASENSKLTLRFELSSAYQTTFVETDKSLQKSLEEFANPADTEVFPVVGGDKSVGIHELRKTSQADIAILVVDAGMSDVRGRARLTPAGPSDAFLVVDCQTMTASYGMAHEIGHILGLSDDGDAVSEISKEYRSGFGFKDKAHGFRTLMTSAVDCDDCELALIWSTPKATWSMKDASYPAGTAELDSVTVIEKTAGAVSRHSDKL